MESSFAWISTQEQWKFLTWSRERLGSRVLHLYIKQSCDWLITVNVDQTAAIKIMCRNLLPILKPQIVQKYKSSNWGSAEQEKQFYYFKKGC